MSAIDLIVSKKAQDELDKLYSKLNLTYNEIIKINRLQLDFNGGSSPKNFVDYNKALSDHISIQKQTNQLSIEHARLTTQIVNGKKAEALENAKLRIELSNINKERKLEALNALGQLNAYQKLDAELKNLRLDVKGLAADMFLLEQAGEQAGAEYQKLNNIYSQNLQRVTLLDNGLKSIDSKVGQYQRNVGNYASGWNGLGNAINQLTREFPAFTVSAQTGILALSNNLPILSDEISRLIKTNKELIAQGKPVQSVFSQIISSVFSFGTALSVGITLLTVYGKEIGNWFSNLLKTARAFDAIREAQKQQNDASVQGRKNAQDELIALRANLEIAKDVNLSYKERNIAVKALIDQFPFYFEGLTKEKILAGQTKDAEDALTNALLSRAKAQAATTKITENQAQIIDLEERRIQVIERLKQAEDRLSAARNRTNAASASETAYQTEINALQAVNSQKSKLAKIDKEISDLNLINNRLTSYAILNQKESIGLDYQEEKSTKAKADAKRKNIDAIDLEAKSTQGLVDRIKDHIKYIEQSRDAVSKNSSEYEKFNKILIALNLQYRMLTDFDKLMQESTVETINRLEAQSEEAKKGEEAIRRLTESARAYIETFKTDFFSKAGLGSLNFFTTIKESGLTAYEELMIGADVLNKKFVLTFLAITEVAQEAFAFINQASQENFNAEYERLNRRKEVAIMFAGDSATARDAIEQQYEQKRREIERREAQSKKELALFNIAVDTAQAIISLWVKPGFPQAIPLAVAVGAIGATQAAIVSSQQIPQFWKGTDNAPRGWAYVDERGPEVHTDSKGNVKSMGSEKGANLRFLEKGDKIYKTRSDFFLKGREMMQRKLESSFMGNTAPNISFQGVTSSEMDAIMDRHMSKHFSKIQVSQTTIDRNGFRSYIIGSNAKTELTNNRSTSKGYSV